MIAGLIFTFKNYVSNTGSTVIEKKLLLNQSIEILKDNDGIYSPTLLDMENIFMILFNNKELIEINANDTIYVTTPNILKKEELVINTTKDIILQNWNLKFSKEEINALIKNYEKINFKLGDKQKEAVKKFISTKDAIFILAGYAGSGKTTTSRLILDTYASKIGKENIVACALSGNAANRIKNVTGYKAYTIHSLLGYTRKGFTFNKDNPLPYKLIVLDESSMVDLNLFTVLLDAIDFEKSKLFLIGDNAQLPPVGMGEVFEDLLNYSKVQKVILDKVYRQKENQVINIFAQEIRKGKVPIGYLKKYEDFEFVKIEIDDYYQKRKEFSPQEFKKLKDVNYQKIQDYILKDAQLYKDTMKSFLEEEKFIDYISYYQVISPIKNGILGTKELNNKLKNILNPVISLAQENMDYIKVGDKKISIFDKVIHLQNKNKPAMKLLEKENLKSSVEIVYERLKNDQEKYIRVFNGQIGIVSNIFQIIDIEEDEDYLEETDYNIETIVEVYFPYEKYFTYYTLNEFSLGIIDLAYSITVHKSQGSEYQNVVMPITFSHFNSLNNKLLYTAVTRAKNGLTIFGETYAFGYACKNTKIIRRNTVAKIIN